MALDCAKIAVWRQAGGPWGIASAKTVQGSSIPLPYGGKTRAVSVDLDPSKLQAYNISPQEVANAINQQSVVLPSGTAKIGKREYDVLINGSTDTIEALNNLPVKEVNRATVYLRDIAFLLKGEHSTKEADGPGRRRESWFLKLHERFNDGFEKLRNFYRARLKWALEHGRIVVAIMLTGVVLSLVFLTPILGEDFFPLVDAGQFRLHVRAPAGTRIEETQRVFFEVDTVIRS